tara:strand:- start:186 stop:413 length:228 start_codon:yes stop_codon:yes gene_type:complete
MPLNRKTLSLTGLAVSAFTIVSGCTAPVSQAPTQIIYPASVFNTRTHSVPATPPRYNIYTHGPVMRGFRYGDYKK